MDLGLVGDILIGLVAAWIVVLVALVVFRPKGVPLRELIRVVPDVIRLLKSVIGDRRVPIDVRAVLAFLLVWIISPIDLIPEFVPILGPLDDVVVAAVALRYTRRRLGSADLRRRWTGSEEGFALLVRLIGSD